MRTLVHSVTGLVNWMASAAILSVSEALYKQTIRAFSLSAFLTALNTEPPISLIIRRYGVRSTISSKLTKRWLTDRSEQEVIPVMLSEEVVEQQKVDPSQLVLEKVTRGYLDGGSVFGFSRHYF